MLRRNFIADALERRLMLSGPSGIEIAWPNLASSHNPPYLEVDHATAMREGGGIRGSYGVREIGDMQVTVVTAGESGEEQAFVLAEEVADCYAAGTNMEQNGIVVTITQPCSIIASYKDETLWRTPVMVRYSALSVQ